VRTHGLDGFTVSPIDVPAFGPVAVEHARHPFFDAWGLRAYVPGRRGVALGRLLSGRARRGAAGPMLAEPSQQR
jgi:hypothetical protein